MEMVGILFDILLGTFSPRPSVSTADRSYVMLDLLVTAFLAMPNDRHRRPSLPQIQGKERGEGATFAIKGGGGVHGQLPGRAGEKTTARCD